MRLEINYKKKNYPKQHQPQPPHKHLEDIPYTTKQWVTKEIKEEIKKHTQRWMKMEAQPSKI